LSGSARARLQRLALKLLQRNFIRMLDYPALAALAAVVRKPPSAAWAGA